MISKTKVRMSVYLQSCIQIDVPANIAARIEILRDDETSPELHEALRDLDRYVREGSPLLHDVDEASVVDAYIIEGS